MLQTGIVNEAIQPEEVLAGFPAPEDGACVLFLGVVRDHNEGRSVTSLEYEAYRGMAEKTLAAIAEEAGKRFGTDRITVLHRIGELQVGAVATAIAVATPHRAEAYEASRYIIEEIKGRLPVWKREHYLEGGSEWTGGVASPAPAPGPSGLDETLGRGDG